MEEVNLIGQQINCLGSKGTIKYVGPIRHEKGNSSDQWLGIEWFSSQRGKHQGTVKDFEYFKCSEGTSGSLLKSNPKYFGTSLFKAYFRKYFQHEQGEHMENLDDNQLITYFVGLQKKSSQKKSVQFFNDAIFKTSKKFKRIEFFGFDSIWNLWKDVQCIERVSLDDQYIQSIGSSLQLNKIFTNLRVLSMERNNLHSWSQVHQIQLSFPKLEELYIGDNFLLREEDIYGMQEEFRRRFHPNLILAQNEFGYQPFKHLRVICLRKMNLTWKEFNEVKGFFQNVEEIIANENQLNDFENTHLSVEQFPNLKYLDLTSNSISSLEGMASFTVNLTKLNLGSNSISSLPWLDCIKGLTHLNLRENQISDLEFLHQASKYGELISLKVGLNPLIKFHDKDHLRCLLFASCRKLKLLNGSELKKRER